MMKYITMTENIAKPLLPKRDPRGHKGSFGRAFAYIGSKKFPGAAHLATEAMLRGGCGYTEVAGDGELIMGLLSKFPEAIYTTLSETEKLKDAEIRLILDKSLAANATLIGSGSGCSEPLARLTEALLELDTEKPIIIDADALNSLARYSDADEVIFSSCRRVILTPHEMEFSRITGLTPQKIKADRIGTAENFAKDLSCVVVLKGNGTVITDGETTYVNPTGSTALAKGGSGDALAGLMTSLIASSDMPPVDLAALACYIHGLAGDRLADIYSDFGVTPSDLPREMAKIIRLLSGNND